MRGIIKNKKILFLILFIIFIPLFGFKLIMAAGCATDCTTCGDEASCNNSPAGCQWDTVENKCCHKTEILWPPSPANTQLTGCSSLTIMVKYFYEWGISLGGLAAFVSLVIAGFLYLTSAGNPAKMQEAKNRVFGAFGGLALLLGSWLLLNTINPQLTTLQTIPFELATSTVSTSISCQTDDECEAKCASTTGPVECSKYIHMCQKGTEQKMGTQQEEGMCVQVLKPCDYAVLYSEVNFEGVEARINPDENIPIGLAFEARSVRTFYNSGTSTDQSAGGCTLQLFAGAPWYKPWAVCGDRMATVPAHETDLYRWVDRNIRCVKLVQPSSESIFSIYGR